MTNPDHPGLTGADAQELIDHYRRGGRRRRWWHRFRLPFLAVVLVAATACTPQQVIDHYRAVAGVELSLAEATPIAEWAAARDCLPAYEASQYVECAIADGARAYGHDLDRFARMAWCESRLEPDAANASDHVGLFQFSPTTWAWIATRGAPHADLPRTHARANALTAAWLLAVYPTFGVGHPWAASAGCWAGS